MYVKNLNKSVLVFLHKHADKFVEEGELLCLDIMDFISKNTELGNRISISALRELGLDYIDSLIEKGLLYKEENTIAMPKRLLAKLDLALHEERDITKLDKIKIKLQNNTTLSSNDMLEIFRRTMLKYKNKVVSFDVKDKVLMSKLVRMYNSDDLIDMIEYMITQAEFLGITTISISALWSWKDTIQKKLN